MDRLTKYSKETTHENGVCCTHFGGMECFARNGDCSRGCTWEEAAWSRLADYEDTGYTPEEIAKLQGDLIQRNAELLEVRESLQGAKNTAEQYAAINETLFDSNMKLGADRKGLINELCQYCGKYKQAHGGACDGCKWREQ